MNTKQRYYMINTLQSYKTAKLFKAHIFKYEVNYNISEFDSDIIRDKLFELNSVLPHMIHYVGNNTYKIYINYSLNNDYKSFSDYELTELYTIFNQYKVICNKLSIYVGEHNEK